MNLHDQLLKAIEDCKIYDEDKSAIIAGISFPKLVSACQTISEEWAKGQMKREWISVEERLPDGDYDVLIYALSFGESGGIGIGRYWGKGKGISPKCKDWTNVDVTHWQELPEPPITK